MRDALPRLRKRIEELRAFDVSSVTERSDPRIAALEQRVNATLADIFGHDTFEYQQFGDVQIDRASLNLYHPTPMHEVRVGLSRGVGAVIESLEGLVVLFEERLGSAAAAPPLAPSHAPYDRRQQLILPSQRNAVLEAVKNAGLDPSEFRWAEQLSRFERALSISRLVHHPSGGFFDFDFKNGKQFAHMSPGKENPEGFEWPGTWDGQLQCVRQWLGYLSRELAAPDLWAAFATSLEEIATSDFATGLERFSQEEVGQISAEIRELRLALERHFSLTHEDIQLVERRLGTLEGAARAQTRQAWWFQALGVCMSLVLAVPSFQQELDHVVGYFRAFLASVFARGGGGEPTSALPPDVV